MIKFIINAFKLVPKTYKGQVVMVGINLILMAVLEFLGIGLLLPFILIIAQKEKFIAILKKYAPDLALVKYDYLLITISISLLLFYIFKNLLFVYITRKQLRFSLSLTNLITVKAFKYYFNKDLTFFRKEDDAQILRYINVILLIWRKVNN